MQVMLRVTVLPGQSIYLAWNNEQLRLLDGQTNMAWCGSEFEAYSDYTSLLVQ